MVPQDFLENDALAEELKQFLEKNHSAEEECAALMRECAKLLRRKTVQKVCTRRLLHIHTAIRAHAYHITLVKLLS